MQRVVKRMLHAAVAASVSRWCDSVQELHLQRGIMERVALRMKNAGMFTALQRWRENCAEKKAMVAKSTKVVLRWKLQAVVWCLEAWSTLTAEEVRKRYLMGRILECMLHRSLSFAMELWQLAVEEGLQARREDEVQHLRSMVKMGSQLRDGDRSAQNATEDLLSRREQEVVELQAELSQTKQLRKDLEESLQEAQAARERLNMEKRLEAEAAHSYQQTQAAQHQHSSRLSGITVQLQRNGRLSWSAALGEQKGRQQRARKSDLKCEKSCEMLRDSATTAVSACSDLWQFRSARCTPLSGASIRSLLQMTSRDSLGSKRSCRRRWSRSRCSRHSLGQTLFAT
jgi:hypothetical protein